MTDGWEYPVAPLPFNGDDTTGHYEYHTFAMEWLPHEVRFLVDSVVVRRWPDRLVPPGNPNFDWVTQTGRSPAWFHPAELDVDNAYDQTYFEHEVSSGWPGCWPDKYGRPAAHHLLDYVKVWDVPKDVIVPSYPQ